MAKGPVAKMCHTRGKKEQKEKQKKKEKGITPAKKAAGRPKLVCRHPDGGPELCVGGNKKEKRVRARLPRKKPVSSSAQCVAQSTGP
jgi:hypothetical protein